MAVVSILSQKGGTGKSTLALNLAAAFAGQGQSVLLFDSDSQASCRVWASRSGPDGPPGIDVRELGQDAVFAEVRAAAAEHDWVVIDGPPRLTSIIADAIRVADLVVIPATPGPFDLWACPQLVAAVKASQTANGGRPAATFVVTADKPGTLLSRHIDESLAAYGLPVMASRTTDRVAYPMTIIAGQSVFDGRDRTAQQQMSAIRDEIERLLNGHTD
jgi:chromosome partitioning protein